MINYFPTSVKQNYLSQIFNLNESTDQIECLDYVSRIRLTDHEAKEGILKIITMAELVNIKSMPKAERDLIIKKLKTACRISNRQIARILGVSEILIRRA